MIHAVSLSVFVACDIYIEVAEGVLDQTWKDNNIVNVCTFRDLISKQVIKYNPTYCKYSGDAKMRPSTQQNQGTRYESNYDSRGKIFRPLAEDI